MHSDWINSPGMGTTPAKISKLPLATEGEATTGPDDELNWDELETAGPELPDVPMFRLDVEPEALWDRW